MATRVIRAVTDALNSLRPDEVRSNLSGRTLIHKMGEQPTAVKKEDAERDGLLYLAHSSREPDDKLWSLPQNWVEDTQIAPGLLAVVAAPLKGKTTMLQALQRHWGAEQTVIAVRAIEPTVPGESPAEPTIEGADAAIAQALLDQDGRVVTVDSLRFLVLMKSYGAFAAGGFSLGALLALTAMNEAARSCGKLLAAAIYVPMLSATNVEGVERYAEDVAGSVSATLFLPEPGVARFSSRVGQRSWRQFEWKDEPATEIPEHPFTRPPSSIVTETETTQDPLLKVLKTPGSTTRRNYKG